MRLSKRAKVIGAVNTLKYTENGYVGYNTDIIGVYYAIKNKGFDVKGKISSSSWCWWCR